METKYLPSAVRTQMLVASSVTWFESGENTVIQAEVSGDTTVDFIITLAGIDHNLSASDFIL